MLEFSGYRNGFPFVVPQAAEDDELFSEWDGTTYWANTYGSTYPSKSATDPVTTYGDGTYYPVGLTLAQATRLYWIVKHLEVTPSDLVFNVPCGEGTSYDLSPGPPFIAPMGVELVDKPTEMIPANAFDGVAGMPTWAGPGTDFPFLPTTTFTLFKPVTVVLGETNFAPWRAIMVQIAGVWKVFPRMDLLCQLYVVTPEAHEHTHYSETAQLGSCRTSSTAGEHTGIFSLAEWAIDPIAVPLYGVMPAGGSFVDGPLTITPTLFRSYGGKYDTSTGALL